MPVIWIDASYPRREAYLFKALGQARLSLPVYKSHLSPTRAEVLRDQTWSEDLGASHYLSGVLCH